MKACIAATLTCVIVATLVSSGGRILRLRSRERGMVFTTLITSRDLIEEVTTLSPHVTTTGPVEYNTAGAVAEREVLPTPSRKTLMSQFNFASSEASLLSFQTKPPLKTRVAPSEPKTRLVKTLLRPTPVSSESDAALGVATQQATPWLQGLHVPREFWSHRPAHNASALSLKAANRLAWDRAERHDAIAATSPPPALLASPSAAAARLLQHARSTGDAWLCAAALTHARLHLLKGRACTEARRVMCVQSTRVVRLSPLI
jgi:hypothetical protein